MDENSASRILESVERGGGINPTALSVGIRATIKECLDSKGMVSTACLYEISCQLERKGKKWYD